jgi:hypothetical protein
MFIFALKSDEHMGVAAGILQIGAERVGKSRVSICAGSAQGFVHGIVRF